MHTIISILLILAGIIALLLIMGLFMKKEHYVSREIIINAPLQKVFDYVKLLKNLDKYNKHAMADPDRNREYKGTDGTVGFIISWNGNKDVGEGQKEIINIVEGKRIESQIRFVRPMATTANIMMETESLPGNKTNVRWSNAGTLKYPLNILIPVFQIMFAKDMNSSLLNLKNILEK